MKKTSVYIGIAVDGGKNHDENFETSQRILDLLYRNEKIKGYVIYFYDEKPLRKTKNKVLMALAPMFKKSKVENLPQNIGKLLVKLGRQLRKRSY